MKTTKLTAAQIKFLDNCLQAGEYRVMAKEGVTADLLEKRGLILYHARHGRSVALLTDEGEDALEDALRDCQG